MSPQRKRILVLGGGCGGLVAATQLGARLGRDHEVMLVDRRAEHVFMPAFLFVMVGQRQPADIQRKLKRLERRNIKVVQSEVEGIDLSRQKVVLESGPLSYDYLVVSLGLQIAPRQIPGFAEGAHHAWEMDAALRLRQALERFESGRVLVGVPPGPYRCPPAPYETQWMLDSYFREKGRRQRVSIEFFTPGIEPSGRSDDPAVWMDAESKRRGIKQHYSFFVESVDPERRFVSGRFGVKLSYDLLFLIPPHHPSPVLVESGLADTPSGISVDYDTMTTRWENVFAVGDCADMPVAKAGGVAHQQAEVVAHNIAVKLRGQGEPARLRLQTI